MKSEAAQAASIIRKELKKNGIKATVRSESTGGSSIDITVFNQMPATVQKIEEFAGSFKCGHFNGMEDIYEYSNRNDDIPQVNFIFIENAISDDVRQAAWDYVRSYYGGYEEAPESYEEARFFTPTTGGFSDHADMMTNRVLHSDDNSGGFWTEKKERIAA